MTESAAGEVVAAWNTPILVGRVAIGGGLNERLRAFILTERARHSHLGVGTVNAAKTGADLLRLDDPVVDSLRELVLDVAEALNAKTLPKNSIHTQEFEMVAEAWAVVYDRGGYHKIHAHHDSAWSGVYYVHTGEMTPGAGLLELVDPRPAAAASEPHRTPLLAISPAPGLVVAFPSWVQHWVTPYDGDDQRICVAFNVGFAR